MLSSKADFLIVMLKDMASNSDFSITFPDFIVFQKALIMNLAKGGVFIDWKWGFD